MSSILNVLNVQLVDFYIFFFSVDYLEIIASTKKNIFSCGMPLNVTNSSCVTM